MDHLQRVEWPRFYTNVLFSPTRRLPIFVESTSQFRSAPRVLDLRRASPVIGRAMRAPLLPVHRRSLAVTLLLSFCAAGAHADQSGAAVLIGTIVDGGTGKPAADVVVTATSSAQQGQQVVVTDPGGFYRIPNLAPGTYVLSLDRDGYTPFSRDDVVLRADATLRVNAVLIPEGGKAHDVVIIQQAPTIDVGSSSVGSGIAAEFTHRVPVAPPSGKGAAGRSFEAVAEVTPGAKGDTYGLSVAGAS